MYGVPNPFHVNPVDGGGVGGLGERESPAGFPTSENSPPTEQQFSCNYPMQASFIAVIIAVV